MDLTGSGKSYEFNRDNDPSLTEELLQFYARCYTQDPTDPLCSPLLGDLTGFPPTLIFAGGDEILLDDARGLHERLKKAGEQKQADHCAGALARLCALLPAGEHGAGYL